METKKAAALGIAGLAVGFVLGYGSGRISTGTPLNPLSGGGRTYEDGYAAAKQKLVELGIASKTPPAMLFLNGTVKSVGDRLFVMTVTVLPPNPLDGKAAPSDRTVRVTAATTIFKRTLKTQVAYDAEIAAYRKAPDGKQPPQPYALVPATLADLAPGMQASVSAASDIYAAPAFDALQVVVEPAR